eukprot:scaffold2177_cov373-Prasinococcus_capsulatus_cf.AAC.3
MHAGPSADARRGVRGLCTFRSRRCAEHTWAARGARWRLRQPPDSQPRGAEGGGWRHAFVVMTA